MPRNVSIKNMAEIIAAKATRPAGMKPQFVDGRWIKAKLSALQIARMRKTCLQRGDEWKWDIPHKIVEKRIPFKGHKRDLRRKEKEEEIKRCMARMPKLIVQHHERERKRRAERLKEGQTGLEKLLKTPREYTAIIMRK